MNRNTVCILSGGMDSVTLAALAHSQGALHSCLSFDYGQKHKRELECAKAYCNARSINHWVISLKSIAEVCFLGSALTSNQPMPEGHYADDNMKQTVVPNRNMVMLSIAVAYAVANKLSHIWYGAHSGDHTIYPDCRPEFVSSMNEASKLANWQQVEISAPFLFYDKHRILQLGYQLGVDYAGTWTCYNGGAKACGKCGSCQERLEAFAKLGVPDPLEYA